MSVVMTYKGKDIETLSREELLEALRWAFRELESERAWHQTSLDMERLIADTRIQLARRGR